MTSCCYFFSNFRRCELLFSLIIKYSFYLYKLYFLTLPKWFYLLNPFSTLKSVYAPDCLAHIFRSQEKIYPKRRQSITYQYWQTDSYILIKQITGLYKHIFDTEMHVIVINCKISKIEYALKQPYNQCWKWCACSGFLIFTTSQVRFSSTGGWNLQSFEITSLIFIYFFLQNYNLCNKNIITYVNKIIIS
jgi:hypothetical protein